MHGTTSLKWIQSIGGMTLKGDSRTKVVGGKSVPMLYRPQLIPHGLALTWTKVVAVKTNLRVNYV